MPIPQFSKPVAHSAQLDCVIQQRRNRYHLYLAVRKALAEEGQRIFVIEKFAPSIRLLADSIPSFELEIRKALNMRTADELGIVLHAAAAHFREEDRKTLAKPIPLSPLSPEEATHVFSQGSYRQLS